MIFLDKLANLSQITSGSITGDISGHQTESLSQSILRSKPRHSEKYQMKN